MKTLLAALVAATALGAVAVPAAQAQPYGWHHHYWHHHYWRHPGFGRGRFCYHHPYRC